MTLRLNGSTSGYVEIDAPATAGSNTLVLPTGNGTSGQYLQTDGSGGLSWAGAGKILQVVSTTKSDTFSTSSTDFVDVTGLSVSITPSSTSSKILVLLNLTGDGTSGDTRAVYRLVRGSTAIALGDAAGIRPRGFGGIYRPYDSNTPESISASYLDSPASTSAQTYKVQASEGNNTASSVYVNRASGWSDSAGHPATISTITAMEVAA